MTELKREFTIVNQLGLHARASAKIGEIDKYFAARVTPLQGFYDRRWEVDPWHHEPHGQTGYANFRTLRRQRLQRSDGSHWKSDTQLFWEGE